jgi:hypothetical protein
MLSQPDHQADGRPWPSRTQVAAGARGFAEPRFEWRRLLAELGGTFFLVLAAAGADVMNAVSGGQAGRAAAVTAPGIMVLGLSYDPVLRTAGDTRSCWTRRGRGFRWPSTPAANCATGPSRTPTPLKPNG